MRLNTCWQNCWVNYRLKAEVPGKDTDMPTTIRDIVEDAADQAQYGENPRWNRALVAPDL